MATMRNPVPRFKRIGPRTDYPDSPPKKKVNPPPKAPVEATVVIPDARVRVVETRSGMERFKNRYAEYEGVIS